MLKALSGILLYTLWGRRGKVVDCGDVIEFRGPGGRGKIDVNLVKTVELYGLDEPSGPPYLLIVHEGKFEHMIPLDWHGVRALAERFAERGRRGAIDWEAVEADPEYEAVLYEQAP